MNLESEMGQMVSFDKQSKVTREVCPPWKKIWFGHVWTKFQFKRTLGPGIQTTIASKVFTEQPLFYYIKDFTLQNQVNHFQNGL